jgi:hypothetical protein
MSADPLIASRTLPNGLELQLRPLITMARAGVWLVSPGRGVIAGWLYDDEQAARRAFEQWNGSGEPNDYARRPA